MATPRRGFTVIATLVACVAFHGGCDRRGTNAAVGDPTEPTSPPGTARHTPKIIPWLEVNAPRRRAKELMPDASEVQPDQTARDFFLDGLTHWAKVTDTVIVTTRVGASNALYPFVMEHKPPHVHIIGGIKTSILPGAQKKSPDPYDFADATGWQRIAREARDITRVTGNDTIVLESEAALWRFATGDADIDFQALHRSLAPLSETGLRFWLYLPIVLADTPGVPDRQQRTTRLVKTMAAALPDSIYLANYTGWHGWEQRPGTASRRKQMWDLVRRKNVYDMIYVTMERPALSGITRKRLHLPAEAVEQVKSLPGRVVIVYPGMKYWIPVGRHFANHFPKP